MFQSTSCEGERLGVPRQLQLGCVDRLAILIQTVNNLVDALNSWIRMQGVTWHNIVQRTTIAVPRNISENVCQVLLVIVKSKCWNNNIIPFAARFFYLLLTGEPADCTPTITP